MKCLTVAAQVERLEQVQTFIRQELARHDCPPRTVFQIELCVEEIFVNIASYAYPPGTGQVTVCCEVGGEPKQALIRFADSGIPFDPLSRPQVDTSPRALEDRVGGLGILLVKKNMDEVVYGYEGGQNVLTVRKALQTMAGEKGM